MSWGHSDGWPNWEVTARLVTALFWSGTLWHPKPKDYCKVNGIVKTTEKNREPAQIIEPEFRKQFNAIEKTDQTGKCQNGQFTLRANFWSKCPLKDRKLKL